MLDLYVYYKVRNDQAARLETQVRALQARLAERYGVAVQFKRRLDTKDALQTWMEVYAGVDAGFACALAAAADEAGLADLIEGPRRTEIFTELTPCA